MGWWSRRERIAREADAWVARLQGPNANERVGELKAWRAADPEHEAAYRRSEAVWAMAGSAARTRDTVSPHYRTPSSRLRGVRLTLASLAAIIAAAGGTILVGRLHQGSPRMQATIRAAPETLTLVDGSRVRLGPGSSLETHFADGIRGITLLKGSARFTVAHDAAHPFVVTAGTAQVTARGTIFDVVLHPTGLSVRMLEGVVEVTRSTKPGVAPHPPVRLLRGEELTVAGSTEDIRSVPDTDKIGTTRDYPPTPVATIISEANATATKPIRLEDPQLGGRRIQGRFQIKDTDALAHQLAAALDLGLRDDIQAFVLTKLPVAK